MYATHGEIQLLKKVKLGKEDYGTMAEKQTWIRNCINK